MSISKRTREAIYVHAEGRSEASGEPLGPDWQVDHDRARAAGGSDDITNLRATSRAENHTKSDGTPPTLRRWQQEFIETWDRSAAPSFLMVALPGTGKTIAALTVADEWLREDPRRRKLLIVVPTDPLRTQWKQEASRVFGLNCQTKEFTGWKPEMVGAIVTYHLLANSWQTWKLHCSRHDILAICDEVHHASDDNRWGGAVKEAIHLAKRRLLTSGTPFRGDSIRIPFVNYDGAGNCVADYRYDYPAAVRDGVIRVVRFEHARGIVRHLETSTGVVSSSELSRESDDDADETLSRILTPGPYTEAILRLAHERLLEVRARGMTNAGGLAICRDQDHANRIAAQLRVIIGHAPDIVVSDDDIATSTVERFRDSDRSWVVAVKKISEGVDIRRLMVLAYLTTCKTSLFFQQAVGRIVRNLGTDYDPEAYCFIPDHPVLVEHAQHITDAQYHAIADDTDDDETQRTRQASLFDYPSNVTLGTEYTGTAGAIIEGHVIDPAIAAQVSEMARRWKCSEAMIAEIFRSVASGATPGPPPTTGRRSEQAPLEDRLDEARKELNRVVSTHVYRLLPNDDDRFPKLQFVVNQFVGKRRRDFTLDDLKRAIVFIQSDDIRAALARAKR